MVGVAVVIRPPPHFAPVVRPSPLDRIAKYRYELHCRIERPYARGGERMYEIIRRGFTRHAVVPNPPPWMRNRNVCEIPTAAFLELKVEVVNFLARCRQYLGVRDQITVESGRAATLSPSTRNEGASRANVVKRLRIGGSAQTPAGRLNLSRCSVNQAHFTACTDIRTSFRRAVAPCCWSRDGSGRIPGRR